MVRGITRRLAKAVKDVLGGGHVGVADGEADDILPPGPFLRYLLGDTDE